MPPSMPQSSSTAAAAATTTTPPSSSQGGNKKVVGKAASPAALFVSGRGQMSLQQPNHSQPQQQRNGNTINGTFSTPPLNTFSIPEGCEASGLLTTAAAYAANLIRKTISKNNNNIDINTVSGSCTKKGHLANLAQTTIEAGGEEKQSTLLPSPSTNLKTLTSNVSSTAGIGSIPSKYVLISQSSRVAGQMITLEGYPGAAVINGSITTGGPKVCNTISNVNGNGGDNGSGDRGGSAGIVLLPSSTSSITGSTSLSTGTLVAGQPLELQQKTTSVHLNIGIVGKTSNESHNLLEVSGDEELRPLAWLNNSNLIKEIVTTNNNKNNTSRRLNNNNNNNNNSNNHNSNILLKRRIAINGTGGGSSGNICILKSFSNAQDLIEEVPLKIVAGGGGEGGVDSNEKIVPFIAAGSHTVSNGGKCKPLMITNSGHLVDLPPETEITAIKLNSNHQQKITGNQTPQNNCQQQQLHSPGVPELVDGGQKKEQQQQNLLLLDSANAHHQLEEAGRIGGGTSAAVHVDPSGSTNVIEYSTGSGFIPSRQLLAAGSLSGVRNKETTSTTVSTSATLPATTEAKSANVINVINSNGLTLVPSGNPVASTGLLKSSCRLVDASNISKGNANILGKKVSAVLNSTTINTTAPSNANGNSIRASSDIITHHPHKKYLREKMNTTTVDNRDTTTGTGASNGFTIVPTSTLSISSSKFCKTPQSSTPSATSHTTIASNGYSLVNGAAEPLSSALPSLVSTAATTTATTAQTSSCSPPVATTHIPAGYTLVKHPIILQNASPLISPVLPLQSISKYHSQTQSLSENPLLHHKAGVTTANANSTSTIVSCAGGGDSAVPAVNVTTATAAAAASSLLSLAQLNPSAAEITASLQRHQQRVQQQIVITRISTPPTVLQQQNQPLPPSPSSQQQQQQQQLLQRSMMVSSSPLSYSSYDNDSLKDLDLNGANIPSSPGGSSKSLQHQSTAGSSLTYLQSGSLSTASTTPSHTPASTPTPSSTPAHTPPRYKSSNNSSNNSINLSYNPMVHTHNKPPYSFSSLIFMAIDESDEKALPVKEIYAWIEKHFPYFKTAPTGWKNSVRHNLSLNKSFVKVEKAQNMGKGSLWRVEPQKRSNLLQTLCRSPYYQQSQAFLTNSVGEAMVMDDVAENLEEQSVQHHLDELLNDSPIIPGSCSNSIGDVLPNAATTVTGNSRNGSVERHTNSSRSSCSSISSNGGGGGSNINETTAILNYPPALTPTPAMANNNNPVNSRFDPTLFPNLSKVFGKETLSTILADIALKDTSHSPHEQKPQQSVLVQGDTKNKRTNDNNNSLMANVEVDIVPTKRMKMNPPNEPQQRKIKHQQNVNGVVYIVEKEKEPLEGECGRSPLQENVTNGYSEMLAVRSDSSGGVENSVRPKIQSSGNNLEQQERGLPLEIKVAPKDSSPIAHDRGILVSEKPKLGGELASGNSTNINGQDNDLWINSVFGGLHNYHSLESLARDHGVDNIEDAQAAVVMLAFKYGRTIFDRLKSAAPVITSSPNDDHTYSTGGNGEHALILTLPHLLTPISNNQNAAHDGPTALIAAASAILSTTIDGSTNKYNQQLQQNHQSTSIIHNKQHQSGDHIICGTPTGTTNRTTNTTATFKPAAIESEEIRKRDDGVEALLALSLNSDGNQTSNIKRNWKFDHVLPGNTSNGVQLKKSAEGKRRNRIIVCSKTSMRTSTEAGAGVVEQHVFNNYSIGKDNSNIIKTQINHDKLDQLKTTDLRHSVRYENNTGDVKQSIERQLSSSSSSSQSQSPSPLSLSSNHQTQNTPVADRIADKRISSGVSNRSPLRSLKAKVKRNASSFR